MLSNIVYFLIGAFFGIAVLIVISCLYASSEADKQTKELIKKNEELLNRMEHPDTCDGNSKEKTP